MCNTCHHWNILPQCNNPTLSSVHFFLQKSTSKIQTARPSCVAKCCLKHKRNCVVAEYPCGLAVFGMRTVLDVGSAPPCTTAATSTVQPPTPPQRRRVPRAKAGSRTVMKKLALSSRMIVVLQYETNTNRNWRRQGQR